MKLATATILASCAWTACSLAGAPSPGRVEPGKAFSLRPGESAQTADGTLQIGFDGVTSDSRCPKGVQCIWAGDATVRVWLQRGPGPREALDLHTSPSATQAVRVGEQELRLLRLDPYPEAGKQVAKADHVATFALAPPAAPAPDR